MVGGTAQGLYQHGTSRGILGYLRQWDDHRRLLLVPPGKVPRDGWGELFEVIKDDDATRLVFNRIPRNGKELHLVGAASSTPAGHALCDIVVPPRCAIRLNIDDLSDYFRAWAGLLMGDLNASDWAVEAHMTLLTRSGWFV